MKKLKYIHPVTRLALTIMAGSGFVVASHSVLAEPGIYAGAAYGEARVDGGDFNDNSQVLKAFIGGKFNDYIGVEAAANDYGQAKGTGYKSDLTGYTLALVGFLPLGDRFNLFAKVGNLWWKDDYTILNYSHNASGNEAFYGLGAQYNLTEMFALRLEMERYKVDLKSNEIGFNLNNKYDVDVASLGVVFNF